MTEITVLDWVVARLRFWRRPPAGLPTVAELWSESGPVSSGAAAPEPRPRSARPGRWLRLTAGAEPLPLGLLSAFVLALAARGILVGADAAAPVALVLLAGALGAGFFAVRRGEAPWTGAGSPTNRAPAEPKPRLAMLGAALIAAALAGLAARDNRAGLDVVLPWGVAVVLIAAALGGGSGRPDWRRWLTRIGNLRVGGTILPVAAITLLALIVRSIGLADVPAEMTSVHAELLTAAHAVHTGEAPIVAPSSTGGWYPAPVLATAVLAPLAGGLGFGALKLGSLLAGLAAVPFIFLLGRELGGRAVGLGAAALAAVGSWPDLLSRIGLAIGWYPALVAAALAFLVRGLNRQRRMDLVAAGVATGVALLSHPTARSLLVTVVVIQLVAVALAVRHRRRAAAGFSVVVLVAVVTGLPALAAAPAAAQAAGPLGWLGAAVGDRNADVADGLAERAGRVLALPVVADGGAWFHGGTGRPAMDPVAASLLVLGLGLAIATAVARRRLDWAALVVSLPLLMLPAMVSPLDPQLAPSPVRCAGALAPCFVAAGAALSAIAHRLRASLDGAAGRWLGIGSAVSLIALSALAGRPPVHTDFAEAWDRSSWNASELGAVVRGALAVGVAPDRIRVVPYPHWVDTRLVAFEAGLAGRDLALDLDRLDAVNERGGPLLFLVHPDDRVSLAKLKRRLPRSTQTRHPARQPGRTFVSVMTLGASGGR